MPAQAGGGEGEGEGGDEEEGEGEEGTVAGEVEDPAVVEDLLQPGIEEVVEDIEAVAELAEDEQRAGGEQGLPAAWAGGGRRSEWSNSAAPPLEA